MPARKTDAQTAARKRQDPNYNAIPRVAPESPEPDGTEPVTVRVVAAHPIAHGGEIHAPGATFSGEARAVRDALARGLVVDADGS